MGIKIAVIGAASSYTPELFANLAEPGCGLEVDQVVLMDPNRAKAAVLAQASARLVERMKRPILIKVTGERREALAGADFVILQIRIGGLAGRIRDEIMPRAFGLVGNETVGAGGFVSALRTIPTVLDIAQDMEKLCPEAWLLNLSNPAGILTEAVLKYSQISTLGFCNIPINTQYALGALLGAAPERVRLESFGLNHLSWVRRAYLGDEEVLGPLIQKTHSRRAALYRHGLVEGLIAPALLQTIAMLPGWYLRYYYYPDRTLRLDRRSAHSDGELDQLAERELEQIYPREGYTPAARQILEGKGGAQYYLPVLQVIQALSSGGEAVVIADVRNDGAIAGLPADACVEVPARIRQGRVTALPVGEMPLSVRGLVQTVKAYETLTIEAAVRGERELAIAALMANPLVGSYPKAQAVFAQAIKNEQAYWPKALL